jgi:hypothetical protein
MREFNVLENRAMPLLPLRGGWWQELEGTVISESQVESEDAICDLDRSKFVVNRCGCVYNSLSPSREAVIKETPGSSAPVGPFEDWTAICYDETSNCGITHQSQDNPQFFARWLSR